MKKIAVLGAGMVGSAIAADLSKKFDVTSFDLNEDCLRLLQLRLANITVICADLRNTNAYEQWLDTFDVVVSAVPGFMGYATLQKLITLKKNTVDISFFPEDALQLNELAITYGVTAIVDCGVAPGMTNLILGRYNEEMQVNSFFAVVGGLPKMRIKPFEYKAPFSPIDVIEEYTRPARYVENGFVVTKPALSDAALMNFEKVGTLESFNTDGLRSLLHTMRHIPHMKEKTLRYPGHISLIQALQDAGFFSETPVTINGESVIPLQVTNKILFDQWKLSPTEEEFTIMSIVIEGLLDSKPHTIEYFLYDEYDATSSTASMSRTTAYTCTAAVNLICEGLFSEKGVYPPELVGKHANCFNYIMAYLADRNVVYRKTTRQS
jgi:saccharopine dehydrogenase-like NADP-dependent oxidoreductase